MKNILVNSYKKNIFFIGLSLFIFILYNWVYFIINDPYACNDYFGYYFDSVKLFSGNFHIKEIPPLFPFLLGLFGRIFSIFKIFKDPFIFAGQFISLFSTLGTTYFTYKIIKYFFNNKAVFPLLYLIVSPFFLSLISNPQTDMLFLFFVSFFFYSLISKKKFYIIMFALVLVILTRNEGILFVIFLIRKDWIKQIFSNTKLLISFIIFSTVFTFILYTFFFHRLINKLLYLVNSGLLVYYFKNPIQIQKLIWGDFFYFIPGSLPSIIKWSFFYILLVFFFWGGYYLFLRKKTFFYQTFLFLLLFIMFKGYAKELNPATEFRRWLPFLWTFFIVFSLGGLNVIKMLYNKKNKIPWFIFFSIFTVLTIIIAESKFFFSYYLLILFVFLPIIFYVVGVEKKINVLYVIIFFIFISNLFMPGIKKAVYYIKNDTDMGSYKVAKWMATKKYTGKVQVLTHIKSFKYFLKDKSKVSLHGYIKWKDEVFNDKKEMRKKFLRYLKKNKPIICFNNYGNLDSVSEKYIKYKKMIKREIREGKYIIRAKDFIYNKKYVGSVLIPNLKKINQFFKDKNMKKALKEKIGEKN